MTLSAEGTGLEMRPRQGRSGPSVTCLQDREFSRL